MWGFAYSLIAPMITFKMNGMGGFHGLSKWTKAAKKRRRIGVIFSWLNTSGFPEQQCLLHASAEFWEQTPLTTFTLATTVSVASDTITTPLSLANCSSDLFPGADWGVQKECPGC